VRGAIQLPENTPAAIRASTARLLRSLVSANGLTPENVISAIFTTTPDLDADFPAHAARELGWTDVPLLGATEVGVPGALPRIVRVLLTVRGVPHGSRLKPVYLDGAERLRPDLSGGARADDRARSANPGDDATHDAAGSRPIRVAIIGLGQIGGSIALALARRGGFRITGYDRDARCTRAALRAGAIHDGARSLEDACRDAAIAVIAVPVNALARTIARAARSLPHGAALLDTGSARGPVTPALAAANAAGVAAVGGHPIAGNEGRGFASARADLFERATFVLLPVRKSPPPLVRRLVQALGARALVATPDAHDRALARTSHLPYVLACALERTGRRFSRRKLSGPGYASATRLAASDPRIAGAYCRANLTELTRAWREVSRDVERRLRALRTP
jgi:prephenate dehydrogenase